MIDNANLRQYIKPQIRRVRAQKSGDTNTKKDFSGGFINITTPNNHKEWRDVSLKYGFIDDFEAAKSGSKESGSTRKLIEGRFAAYADTHKIFYISTPEQKATSNIEPAYLLGDQRKYMIPCPCCGVPIELKWAIEKEGIVGGITWKLDGDNKIIPGSVGYICQECGGFFDDKNKDELLNLGYWQPTAEPSRPGYYSYHLSSLYAPTGMYDWEHYVNDWLEANPIGQPRKEALYKTFVNTCLGETYESTAEAPKANSIQRNTRDYEICTIPEKLSIADGNGRIVLLTLAADMNGIVEDCRLDYEIVAWSEHGASYSIAHGSIGTFIPRENSLRHKVDRERWTYEENKERSVWPLLEQILGTMFPTDTDRKMPILIAGLDCGHYSTYAYSYIDKSNYNIIGLKGDKEDKYIRFGVDVKLFKPAQERQKLYILQVGLIKDKLSDYMALRWSRDDESQPTNFMNFPQPSGGLYQFTNFFEHFESEHRIIATNDEGVGEAARWVKKTSTSQNHMWDCRVYNMVLREIFTYMLGKELGRKDFTWAECAAILTGSEQ